MDEALIEYHNLRVKPEDHWYNLGDVTMNRGGRVQQEDFVNLIRKFNGHKRLLLGNHDHFPIEVYLRAGFEKIFSTTRGIGNGEILFSHFPLHPQSIGSAVANVHGHTHSQPDYPPVVWVDKKTQQVGIKPYINICVERTNYHPITLEDVRKLVRDSIGAYK